MCLQWWQTITISWTRFANILFMFYVFGFSEVDSETVCIISVHKTPKMHIKEVSCVVCIWVASLYLKTTWGTIEMRIMQAMMWCWDGKGALYEKFLHFALTIIGRLLLYRFLLIFYYIMHSYYILSFYKASSFYNTFV